MSEEEFEIEESIKKPSSSECGNRCNSFAGDSTCSAILHIFTHDKNDSSKHSYSLFARIFWGIVVLLAVGGFCILTTYNFVMLAREPISTSITLRRENKLKFPAVTICSLSLFNTTGTILESADIANKLSDLFREVEENDNISGCESIARDIVRDTGINLSFGKIGNLTKNDFNELLLKCTFRGKKCFANDFKPIATVGGICYTFNGPSTPLPRTSRGTGIRQGLRLQLSPKDQQFSLRRDHGFRVLIHNPNEIPTPASRGIVVPLDHTVYIGMSKVDSIDNTQFSFGSQCRNENYITDSDISFPPYNSYSADQVCCEQVQLF